MLIYDLKKKLTDLINIIFAGFEEETLKSYYFFKITLSKKNIKTNEKYEERNLIIYNLYRESAELANSLIICLAHHIDFCNRGETSRRSSDFQDLYQMLLFEAMNQGMINPEELKASNDFKNIKLISKTFDCYWAEPKNENTSILEVYNCYAIKDNLKTMGFKFNPYNFAWEKEFNTSAIEKNKKELISLSKDIQMKVRNTNSIMINIPGQIVVSGNTYKYRQFFINNKYCFKMGRWCKRIVANNFLKEKEIVEKSIARGQGIKIEIEYLVKI